MRTKMFTWFSDYYMFSRNMFQHFIGQVIAVETTGGHGPAGVNLTLARTSMKTVGQNKVEPTAQDPEYFSTMSVKD